MYHNLLKISFSTLTREKNNNSDVNKQFFKKGRSHHIVSFCFYLVSGNLGRNFFPLSLNSGAIVKLKTKQKKKTVKKI